MKKLILLLGLVILSMGCASGIRTRQIGFMCDPKVNEGRDVLVNVVMFNTTREAQDLSRDLEKGGASAWFGGRGNPRHPLYEKANKQVFDLRPQDGQRKPQMETLDKSKLKGAKALLVIAENSGGQAGTAKSVLLLSREATKPTPRKKEYVRIEPGEIRRMGKSWWFFGWRGDLEEL